MRVEVLLAEVVESVDRLALALPEVGDVPGGPERLEGRVEPDVGVRDHGQDRVAQGGDVLDGVRGDSALAGLDDVNGGLGEDGKHPEEQDASGLLVFLFFLGFLFEGLFVA